MSELLDAARAVIDCWDIQEPWKVGRPHMMSKIENLRAAVERTEVQETVGFDEWWEENYKNYCVFPERNIGKRAWTAAQQAERERLRQKVAEIIRLEDFDDVMAVFSD